MRQSVGSRGVIRALILLYRGRSLGPTLKGLAVVYACSWLLPSCSFRNCLTFSTATFRFCTQQ